MWAAVHLEAEVMEHAVVRHVVVGAEPHPNGRPQVVGEMRAPARHPRDVLVLELDIPVRQSRMRFTELPWIHIRPSAVEHSHLMRHVVMYEILHLVMTYIVMACIVMAYIGI